MRLPRTRGDGPASGGGFFGVPTASPHTRGWTRHTVSVADYQNGFPAHAGMDPFVAFRRSGLRGLPRTRGDGPLYMRPAPATGRASPHTRGWTPASNPGSAASSGLPRTRGDGPTSTSRSRCASKASPHTRGWTPAPSSASPARPGFPAHAGMDPGQGAVIVVGKGLPRTRGDGPVTRITGVRTELASPHTRGWTHRQAAREAGGSRLPRTRGDGPVSHVAQVTRHVASPHTRGWTRTAVQQDTRRDGFPAHAGMDPSARRPARLP